MRLTVLAVSAGALLILMMPVPARSSPRKVNLEARVRKAVCARRRRPASARPEDLILIVPDRDELRRPSRSSATPGAQALRLKPTREAIMDEEIRAREVER